MPIVLADKNLPMVTECFSGYGQVQLFSPPTPPQEQLALADMLIIRTVTQVDAKLLRHSKVRFVGTASSGMDHMDCAELEQHGIRCASAAGCNAQAVAEYVISALCATLARQGRELSGLRVGIVGHGNVGNRLAPMLRAAGATCLLNDPPLAETDEDTPYVPLQEALRCDVISLHLPLTDDGPHPSRNLLDRGAVQSLAKGAIVINTARGEVMDEDALCERAAAGELTAIIDVWQNEPMPKRRNINSAAVATPHIAGYSSNAKRRAVAMLAMQAKELYPNPNIKEFDPGKAEGRAHPVSGKGAAAIAAAASAVCDPYRDSEFLRKLDDANEQQQGKPFATARNSWPLRKEFCQQRVDASDPETAAMLSKLGFVAEGQ